MFFLFFEPFRPILALKLAKSAKMSNNIFWAKIRFWHHKTQNLMLSSNPLKKVQTITAKQL
jgi:hypothetical protein